MARFISTLERQVSVGAANFEPIRGVETDGYYTCTEPLAGAEAAAIFQGDDNKWVVGNTIVSGASAENAILWKLDAAQFLGTAPTGNLKLTRVNAKPAFGALVELWGISDKQGKPTGLQLGIMEYEWNADGLWNVDILILQQ